MKTAYRLLPILLAGVMATSCNDLLTETPSSGYDKDTYFESAEKADMAILGIMSSISNYNHYGVTEMAMPSSDDTYFSSRTQTDNKINDISHYRHNSGNDWIQTLWQFKYEGIDRANVAINGISAMPDFETNAELRRLEGEARFLRAFLTFDLIKYWGEVPFTTEPATGYYSSFRPRRTHDELYDIVIEDLTRAAEQLPWATDGFSPERASQGAARALLMRVLLQRAGYWLGTDGSFNRPSAAVRRECYTKVVENWEAFKENGYHDFYPGGYAQLFKDVSGLVLSSKENLWEIAMYQDSGRRNGSAWGIYNGPVVAAPTGMASTEASNYMGRAQGFLLVVPEWYDFFEEVDERRDVMICTYRYTWDSDKMEHVQQERQNNSWYLGKWRREWMPVGQANKNMNYGDVNFCPLRYADVVLMAAEAYNELGETAEAWTLLNSVRERAGATALSTSNYQRFIGRNLAKMPVNEFIDDSSEQGKVRMALYFERGLELAFEGQRKFDLVRWGVLDKALKLFGERSAVNSKTVPYEAYRNFIHGQHELFPIPLKEIQSNHALNGINNHGF
ncbi:MAG: RagB/SusD family nutrient uptake outer membrane protein [Muribaculaceae bacterium]|nr:RagB/SusD family nutrient uptake outer membrane protein [Muribaculaceae bacterium]